MRRFALFAVSAIFVLSLAAYAEQSAVSGSGSIPAPSTASAQSAPAPMTAEQVAELRADIMMARKEFAAAIDAYLAILKDNPRDAMLLNKTGVAYQELGAYDSAAKYYKKSERANKKLTNPVNNLGTLEYGLHHYSKSVNYYKRALKLGASEATVYSNLGYAYYSEKKFELAMDAFNKAVAIDPTVFDSHGGSGGTIMQQRTAPDPGTLNFFLAKSYARAGDAERAAHFLKLARDYGYKDLMSVSKDKDFATVIKDPRIQDVLHNRPSFTDVDSKPTAN
ncbi:MAG TPA: tetratricopeptide repeat protein [Candidatus Aquilonibacter sp.]|nr:tetratricopeptide repeat protein [Candidatus Aquilonibacter sp.]